MDEIFSDQSWLAALLRFEGALASAQAGLGLVPQEAARAINEACRSDRFDPVEIGRQAVKSGTPVLATVEALKEVVGPHSARFVHVGATSQDAMDTATMLLSRHAIDVLLRDLADVASACATLAGRHRLDPMMGRTLLQDALPVTFGLRCANWLMGVAEAHIELRRCRRLLAVQLGGAVGTLVGFSDRGLDVASELAAEVGLGTEVVPWHSVRVRVAQLAAGLAIAAGSAAKISLDILLLAQTEIGEVTLASGGRSSSMAHKRNPIRGVEARAAFAGVLAQSGILLAAVPGELERAAGSWQAEWAAVSDGFKYAGAAVAHTRLALADLYVDTDRMRRNLKVAEDSTPELGETEAIIDRALAFYAEHVK